MSSENQHNDSIVLKPLKEGEDVKLKQTVFARRERNLKAKAEKAEAIAVAKKTKKKTLKVERLKTCAALMQKSLTRRADKSRVKRVKKGKIAAKPKVNTNNNGKILAVVRNDRKLAPGTDAVVKSALKSLSLLSSYHHLIFLPYTEKVMKQLALISPFVYYGFPSHKVVDGLLHKKVYIRPDMTSSEKILVTSNALLEDNMGKEVGVLCVEDLVSVVFNRDGFKEDEGDLSAFEKALKFLHPVEIGEYSVSKAEKLKQDKKIFRYGNLGRDVNKVLQSLL